jgi:long-chain acyl-CoA synthetase
MNTTAWQSPGWPEGVPSEVRGYEKPLFSLLDDAAEEYPNQTFTIFEGAGRSFSQVKARADRIAGFLVSRGLKPGDRAAIFLPNVPHYPEIFFGILKAGGVCVTCNPLYTPAELNFQLKDAGAKVLFVLDHPVLYPQAVEALEGADVRTVVVCTLASYLPRAKALLGRALGKIPRARTHLSDHLFFDRVIKDAPEGPPPLPIDPLKDVALILYTGGTTGVPKGACLSHANLVSNVLTVDEWIRVPEQPGEIPGKAKRGGAHTGLGVLPWYHSFGLTLGLLLTCLTASRLVCMPDPRAGNPPFTELLRNIQRFQVTAMAAVPTIYSAIIHHPLIDRFDLSSLVGCGSGAAPLPAEVIREFESRTGSVIFEGYGLTETSPVVTMNPTNVEQRKIGTVGLPVPGVEVKIVDLEGGDHELPPGQDGEIALSGPPIMLGYWNRPQENRSVFRQIHGKRFFLTGDIGHVDPDDYVVITDRKKDLILVGGFNAYPREIEEILYTHPKVALAAVVGIPDPHTGEAVKAFIQLKPGAEATETEILEFCRTRMAGYKRPRHVEFRDHLPVSMIGKVLRRVLRDQELAAADIPERS